MAAGLGAMGSAATALAAPPPSAGDGLYVGVNGGGEWVSASATLTVASGAGASSLGQGSDKITGALVGGQLGYQAHAGRLALGVEGDLDWANASDSATAPLFSPRPFVFGDMAAAREQYAASVRGKLGVEARRMLLYATGGLALANVRGSANLRQITAGPVTYPELIATQTKTLAGYTVGAGLERRFGPHWGVGVEYRYSDYGDTTFSLGGLDRPFFPAATVASTVHATSQALTGRLNYHF
jgi:outer membrane immunogenic protein